MAQARETVVEEDGLRVDMALGMGLELALAALEIVPRLCTGTGDEPLGDPEPTDDEGEDGAVRRLNTRDRYPPSEADPLTGEGES